MFTLKLTSNQHVDIRIVSLLGDIVYEERGVDASNYTKLLNLHNAEDGIYILQVKGENVSYSERIFINR